LKVCGFRTTLRDGGAAIERKNGPFMKASKNYRAELIPALKDSQEAINYLNAALEEGDSRVFLAALKDVAEAQGGLAKISRMAKLNRENLYRMLSKRGNPKLLGLGSLLDVMGFKLSIEAKTTARAHAHA
jgi:probable addiction module antidote protein